MDNPFAPKPELVPVRFASQIEATKHDPWGAITPAKHPRLNLPAFPIAPHQTSLIESAVQAIPAPPTPMQFKAVPFESVGPSISLSHILRDTHRVDPRYVDSLQLHAWLSVHNALSAPGRFPVAAAMRWGYAQAEQTSSLIWYDVGGTMLCTWPTVRRVGLSLHLSMGHCVLFRQGWMHAHDPSKLEHWVDLTTNYHQLFDQKGRAYFDIVDGYFKGNAYWGIASTMTDRVLNKLLPTSRLGQANVFTGTADVASQPIRFNSDTRSFLHWTVGTPLFPSGSPQAAVLNDARMVMIEAFQEFRDGVSPLPAEPRIERTLTQQFIREEA
jgi:hypothetical protein